MAFEVRTMPLTTFSDEIPGDERYARKPPLSQCIERYLAGRLIMVVVVAEMIMGARLAYALLEAGMTEAQMFHSDDPNDDLDTLDAYLGLTDAE